MVNAYFLTDIFCADATFQNIKHEESDHYENHNDKVNRCLSRYSSLRLSWCNQIMCTKALQVLRKAECARVPAFPFFHQQTRLVGCEEWRGEAQ